VIKTWVPFLWIENVPMYLCIDRIVSLPPEMGILEQIPTCLVFPVKSPSSVNLQRNSLFQPFYIYRDINTHLPAAP
jgi:hypothetical protein